MKKNCLVVVLDIDLENAKKHDYLKYNCNPIFCIGNACLSLISEVDFIVYYFSETASVSTSYQSIALDIFNALPKNKIQWVLNIDNVLIPEGFAFLNELPGVPLKLA